MCSKVGDEPRIPPIEHTSKMQGRDRSSHPQSEKPNTPPGSPVMADLTVLARSYLMRHGSHGQTPKRSHQRHRRGSAGRAEEPDQHVGIERHGITAVSLTLGWPLSANAPEPTLFFLHRVSRSAELDPSGFHQRIFCAPAWIFPCVPSIFL
jgi:hypothetical protein